MDDGDADGFELGDVENFPVVEIVEMAVGDEIKIGAANGAGGGKRGESGAIFEDSGFCDARVGCGKFERGDARRADAVLNCDEAAVVPVEAVGAGERGMRAGIDVVAGESLQIDGENAESVGDEKSFVVGGEGDAVGINEFAMNGEKRESFFGGIEAIGAVVEAIGENDFAGGTDNEIVEAVFGAIVEGKAAEKFCVGRVMEEFGVAAIVFGVGPYGRVGGIETDAEDGEETVAIGGNKIGGVTVGRNLDDFFLGERAEIENFSVGIPGEAFGDEIFFFGDEGEARLGDDGKIAMNFFDELGEFLVGMKCGKFGAAGRIETFAECEALAEEFHGVAAFAEMLVCGGEDKESGGAVGKGWKQFFDGGDLGARFGGVGGFSGSAASFVLLGEGRDRERESCQEQEEKAAEFEDGGHVVVRR